LDFLLDGFANFSFKSIHTIDFHEEIFEERIEPTITALNVERLPLYDLGLIEQHFEELSRWISWLLIFLFVADVMYLS
jgi:hypothetical protein